jgi:hypothetical protein
MTLNSLSSIGSLSDDSHVDSRIDSGGQNCWPPPPSVSSWRACLIQSSQESQGFKVPVALERLTTTLLSTSIAKAGSSRAREQVEVASAHAFISARAFSARVIHIELLILIKRL